MIKYIEKYKEENIEVHGEGEHRKLFGMRWGWFNSLCLDVLLKGWGKDQRGFLI